jgi:hypothetical protein
LLKRRIETLQRCYNVPLNNNKDFDFIKELKEIRSFFKQCQLGSSSYLGKCYIDLFSFLLNHFIVVINILVFNS